MVFLWCLKKTKNDPSPPHHPCCREQPPTGSDRGLMGLVGLYGAQWCHEAHPWLSPSHLGELLGCWFVGVFFWFSSKVKTKPPLFWWGGNLLIDMYVYTYIQMYIHTLYIYMDIYRYIYLLSIIICNCYQL